MFILSSLSRKELFLDAALKEDNCFIDITALVSLPFYILDLGPVYTRSDSYWIGSIFEEAFTRDRIHNCVCLHEIGSKADHFARKLSI